MAAYPLVLISSLVHELGHGVAALATGAEFRELAIYADGSGVATSAGDVGSIGRAVIAAGGLVGPAVAAAILFPLARRPGRARWVLGVLGVLLVVALALVVRNGFGIALVAVLAAVCLGLAAKGSPKLAQVALVFGAVQLSMSVFSRGDYLFAETARTATGTQPSDTAQIAQALILPYWFWGAVCGLVSVAVLAAGVWLLVRRDRRVEIPDSADLGLDPKAS